ncbi:hypothetical protein HDR69_02935 [bacterium]|nr:hypothetical protein [bacterium]
MLLEAGAAGLAVALGSLDSILISLFVDVKKELLFFIDFGLYPAAVGGQCKQLQIYNIFLVLPIVFLQKNVGKRVPLTN